MKINLLYPSEIQIEDKGTTRNYFVLNEGEFEFEEISDTHFELIEREDHGNDNQKENLKYFKNLFENILLYYAHKKPRKYCPEKSVKGYGDTKSKIIERTFIEMNKDLYFNNKLQYLKYVEKETINEKFFEKIFYLLENRFNYIDENKLNNKKIVHDNKQTYYDLWQNIFKEFKIHKDNIIIQSSLIRSQNPYFQFNDIIIDICGQRYFTYFSEMLYVNKIQDKEMTLANRELNFTKENEKLSFLENFCSDFNVEFYGLPQDTTGTKHGLDSKTDLLSRRKILNDDTGKQINKFKKIFFKYEKELSELFDIWQSINHEKYKILYKNELESFFEIFDTLINNKKLIL